MFWRNSCRHSNSSDLRPAPFRGTSAEVAALFEEILREDSLLRVKATGRSMRPFLRGGEVLIIRKTVVSSLRRGDLILFKNRQGVPVIHRIVRKMRGNDGAIAFETKGDAQLSLDEPVGGSEILGKVCRIEGARSLDMEAGVWRGVNYMLAIVHLMRSVLYFAFGSSRALLRLRS